MAYKGEQPFHLVHNTAISLCNNFVGSHMSCPYIKVLTQEYHCSQNAVTGSQWLCPYKKKAVTSRKHCTSTWVANLRSFGHGTDCNPTYTQAYATLQTFAKITGEQLHSQNVLSSMNDMLAGEGLLAGCGDCYK